MLSRKLAAVWLCHALSSSCTEQRDRIDCATSSGALKCLSTQCYASEMDTSGLRSSISKPAPAAVEIVILNIARAFRWAQE